MGNTAENGKAAVRAKKPWYVFYGPEGEELAAMTVRGCHDGEIEATISLLAHEKEIEPAQIEYRVEAR